VINVIKERKTPGGAERARQRGAYRRNYEKFHRCGFRVCVEQLRIFFLKLIEPRLKLGFPLGKIRLLV